MGFIDMRKSISAAMAVLFAALFLINPSGASDRPKKRGSVSVIGGLPQLIAIGGSVRKWDPIHLGIALGFAPIDSLIKRRVSLPDVSLGDDFFIRASTDYSMSSVSLPIRWYPGDGGFFIQPILSYWSLSANLSGDIYSKSPESRLVSGLISGTIHVGQTMAGLMFGQELYIGEQIFLNISAGAAYPFPATTTVSIFSSASIFASLTSTEAELDTAISNLETEIKSGLEGFRKTLPVYPLIAVAIGLQF